MYFFLLLLLLPLRLLLCRRFCTISFCTNYTLVHTGQPKTVPVPYTLPRRRPTACRRHCCRHIGGVRCTYTLYVYCHALQASIRGRRRWSHSVMMAREVSKHASGGRCGRYGRRTVERTNGPRGQSYRRLKKTATIDFPKKFAPTAAAAGSRQQQQHHQKPN